MTIKATEAAEEAKAAKAEKDDDKSKPTGREHWGEGGEFYINSAGRRVRKPTPKSEKE